MNKRFWFEFRPSVMNRLTCSASPAVTPDAGGGGAAAGAAPAGDPPASGAVADKGASPAPGQTPGNSPAPNANDQNLRQMREGYERYSKIGKPEEIEGFKQVYEATFNHATQMAKALGYSEDEVRAALAKDPLKTVRFLEGKYQQASQNPDFQRSQEIEDRIAQAVRKATEPYNQHLNKQIAEQAFTRFENTFNEALSADAATKDSPAEVRELLFDYVSESMQYDPEAVKALREGKTAVVQKYFDEAKTRLFKVFTAWQAHETKKTGGQPMNQQGGAPAKPKIDLDAIANGDMSAFGSRYK